MTNWEKYKDEIIELRKQNKLYHFMNEHADEINYNEFQGRDVLVAYFILWLMEDYKEPEIDWSKVAVDTPILVRNDRQGWVRRYFAEYREGVVYAFGYGTTSWSSAGNKSSWTYAKLAEGHEEKLEDK